MVAVVEKVCLRIRSSVYSSKHCIWYQHSAPKPLTFVVFSNFFRALRKPVRFKICHQDWSLSKTHPIILDQFQVAIKVKNSQPQLLLVLEISLRIVCLMVLVRYNRVSKGFMVIDWLPVPVA